MWREPCCRAMLQERDCPHAVILGYSGLFCFLQLKLASAHSFRSPPPTRVKMAGLEARWEN